MAKKVIIAEDSKSYWPLYRIHLERLNVEVDICENGEKLLEKMLKEKYDAVITDNHMNSSLDGLEVIRRIRKIDAKIPVYMASASDLEKEALSAGATGYIDKQAGADFFKLVVSSISACLQPTQ